MIDKQSSFANAGLRVCASEIPESIKLYHGLALRDRLASILGKRCIQ